MFKRQEFITSIFKNLSSNEFNDLALQLFRFQAQNVRPYREFISYLNLDANEVNSIENIPFLPISAFKNFEIKSSESPIETIFRSSGTTGAQSSQHLVSDLKLYENSFLTQFERVFGKPKEFIVLALLPSYLEREDSSLVYMVNHLINESKDEQSGFYLDNLSDLNAKIKELKGSSKKILLFGVTFAMLEVASLFSGSNWSHVTVVETGGMKGRGKELTRKELHEVLVDNLNLKHIHSEYGMTELLSQAYSESEVFTCPPWMKIIVREIDDPFSVAQSGRTGGINVIDLANIDSCAFIATDDLGVLYNDEKFKVLGRFDHSESRGCNLLLS